MRKLLLILLILLIPTWCWGATVWTANVGGTVYYDASATSCTDVTAVDTASDLEGASTAAGAGGTLNICAGTYSGAMIDAADGFDSTSNNQTIKMVGDVILDGSAVNDHTFRFATTTGNVLDMSAGTLYIYPYYNASAGTNYGIRLEVAITQSGTGAITIDGNSSLHRGLYDSGSNTLTNVTVQKCLNTSACIFTSASSTTLNGLTYDANAGPIYPATSGTMTLNRAYIKNNTNTSYTITTSANGVIVNMRYSLFENNAGPIYFAYTGTHNITNVGFIGNHAEAVRAHASTPVINLNNCLFFANGWNAGADYYTINNNAGAAATINVAYSLGLSSPTILLGGSPSDYWLSANVTDGSGNIRQIPNIISGRRPAIIVLGTDDAPAMTSYVPDTIAPKLAAYGWRGSYAVETDNMTAPRWAIANTLVVAGHEIASHSKTHADMTTLGAEDLEAEMSASKTTIETNISGYTCSTFVPPGNATNDTVRAAALAAGYIGARGGAGSAGSNTMESINIFNVQVKGLYSLYRDNASPTQAVVNANLGAILEYLKWKGGILFLYAHNVTELDADGWDKTLALISQSGVSVMTLREAITYLKTYDPSGDLATADSMTYTRTMVNNPNYTLTSTSPALNAGVSVTGIHDIAGVTDFAGNPIKGPPDIGAYEYQGGEKHHPKMPNMFRILRIGNLDVPEIYITPISLLYAGI